MFCLAHSGEGCEEASEPQEDVLLLQRHVRIDDQANVSASSSSENEDESGLWMRFVSATLPSPSQEWSDSANRAVWGASPKQRKLHDPIL